MFLISESLYIVLEPPDSVTWFVKSEIIYNISKGGTAVLNRDDKFFNFLYKIAKKNKIKVKSFGYSRNSNVRLMSIIKKKTNLQR